jgi:hypothetical protein
MQDPIVQKEQEALQAPPRPPSRTARYQATLAFILNIIQIVCGGVVILTGVTGQAAPGADQNLAGLRFGSIFIFAGLLGLGAAKYKSYGFIIPNMVMSILATICAVSLSFDLLSAFWAYATGHSGASGAHIAVMVIMILVGITEVVCAIWVSVLSGNIVCPCRGTDRGGEAKVYTNYRAKLSLVFGVIQIVVAAATFGLSIALAVLGGRSNIGHFMTMVSGFGTGTLIYLTAGILGIVTSFRRTLPQILTHMILCILAAICSGTSMTMAIYMVALGHDGQSQSGNRGVLACAVILLLVTMLEFCVAISASTLCCRVTCCGPSQNPPRVYSAYKFTQGRVVGALQIVFGILTFVMMILSRFFAGPSSMIAALSFPCVLMSIIAGSFGVNASGHKKSPQIMAHWILSLLTVLAALTQLWGSITLLRYGTSGPYSGHYNPYGEGNIATGVVLMLFAVVIIAMSFWAAAISYQATVANAHQRYAEKSGKAGVNLQMKV